MDDDDDDDDGHDLDGDGAGEGWQEKTTICYRDGLCPRCASGSVGLVLFE